MFENVIAKPLATRPADTRHPLSNGVAVIPPSFFLRLIPCFLVASLQVQLAKFEHFFEINTQRITTFQVLIRKIRLLAIFLLELNQLFFIPLSSFFYFLHSFSEKDWKFSYCKSYILRFVRKEVDKQ
jgi:hypothetical protein